MNTSRDPERLIHTFLEDGINELPDGSYDVVRASIDNTRQRVVFGPWRTDQMTRYATSGIAAAAIVLIAVLSIQFLPRDNAVAPNATPAPTLNPTSEATSAPTQNAADLQHGPWIAFAADSMGGPSLTDAIDYGLIETRPSDMDIYLVSESQPAHRIVGTGAHERCPAFSPDGSRLAYLESGVPGAPGAPSLVVGRIDAAGEAFATELRIPLTSSPSAPGLHNGSPCPQWSPDGRSIAHLSKGGTLQVLSADDGEKLFSTFRSGISGFAWSPDSDALAYSVYLLTSNEWHEFRNWTLMTIGLDGEELPLWSSVDGTSLGSVRWSPDNKLAVAVTTEVMLDEETGFHQPSIAVVRADGRGQPEFLDELSWPDGELSWSSDGSTLATVDILEYGVPYDAQVTSIALIDVASGRRVDVEPVMYDETWRPTDVRWSAGGTRLLARVVRTGAERAWALVDMAPDGTDVRVLTPWTLALDWVSLQDASSQQLATNATDR